MEGIRQGFGTIGTMGPEIGSFTKGSFCTSLQYPHPESRYNNSHLGWFWGEVIVRVLSFRLDGAPISALRLVSQTKVHL